MTPGNGISRIIDGARHKAHYCGSFPLFVFIAAINKTPGEIMKYVKGLAAGFAVVGSVALLSAAASGQEVKNDGKSEIGNAKVPPFTQSELNSADKNSKDFLLTNGNYAQTRFYPAKQIN